MFIIADNLSITNRTFSEALHKRDPEPIQKMVRQCELAGADAIDLNSGPLPGDSARLMGFLVETVQAVTDLPILIDTPNPKAMEIGLQANTKTAIINAFTLEPGRLATHLPLAQKYDVDIIGYLIYPNGHVPPDATDRLNLAVDLYAEFSKTGLDPQRLIIDPILVPIAWNNGTAQAMENLIVIETLPQLLGFEVRTVAALSNFTTGGGSRHARQKLENAYLPMLIRAGLHMVMMDITHTHTLAQAQICRMLTNREVFAWDCQWDQD